MRFGSDRVPSLAEFPSILILRMVRFPRPPCQALVPLWLVLVPWLRDNFQKMFAYILQRRILPDREYLEASVYWWKDRMFELIFRFFTIIMNLIMFKHDYYPRLVCKWLVFERHPKDRLWLYEI